MPHTIVHALQQQAAQLGDRPAWWTKRQGTFLPTSWREGAKRVKHFALGLVGLGFPPGSTLAVMGSNREEWLVAHLGAMAAGGVPMGLYTSSTPEQVQAMLAHAEVEVFLAEDVRLASLVLALKPRLPKLRQVLVMDAAGGVPEGVLAYTELLARGASADEGPFWERMNGLRPEGLASLVYTSGATGQPKAVMLSHRNLVWTAQKLARSYGLDEEEHFLSYLPLAHVGEQLFAIHLPILVGAQVSFSRSFEALRQDLREVRPTVFYGVPRVWERLRTRVEEGLARLPEQLTRVVARARRASTQWHTRELEGEPIGPLLRGEYALAKRLVFEPMRIRLGFDRTRLFVSTSAPISRELLEFFLSLDVVVREVYGQGETSGPTSLNTPRATQLGRAGRPMLGVEVRIAPDGEVLVRGDNVCMGYLKDAEATAALLADGWLHSGDLGELDDEGYLRIAGRRQDLIVTASGRKVAPDAIEGLLRGIVPVGHAVVLGEGREHLVALLALDPDATRELCTARGWPDAPAELERHPEFRAYLKEQISAQVNARLAGSETLEHFAILPRHLSVEAGELTPTLKVRRAAVAARYKDVVEALFAESLPARSAG